MNSKQAGDSPKGLYMVFVKTDTEASMGRVVGLTQTSAWIRPWNFRDGGIDEDKAIEVVLADQKTLTSFEDMEEMDEWFAVNFWNPMLDKNLKQGTIV